jgi:hypothetical protein
MKIIFFITSFYTFGYMPEFKIEFGKSSKNLRFKKKLGTKKHKQH